MFLSLFLDLIQLSVIVELSRDCSSYSYDENDLFLIILSITTDIQTLCT